MEAEGTKRVSIIAVLTGWALVAFVITSVVLLTTFLWTALTGGTKSAEKIYEAGGATYIKGKVVDGGRSLQERARDRFSKKDDAQTGDDTDAAAIAAGLLV